MLIGSMGCFTYLQLEYIGIITHLLTIYVHTKGLWFLGRGGRVGKIYPIGSMGRTVYLPTFIINQGKCR